MGFISYLGFANSNIGTALSWALAFLIVILYCFNAAKISAVKYYMFKMDRLKVVANSCSSICRDNGRGNL
tara:strand:+ start:1947 stop:2156 length:210 start_codon:yes stop_codon:yes gene_type:complete